MLCRQSKGQVAVFIAHTFCGERSPITDAARCICAFSACYVVTEFFPGISQVNAILISMGAGVYICIPIWKSGNHTDGVKSLLLAKSHCIFKTNTGAWLVII